MLHLIQYAAVQVQFRLYCVLRLQMQIDNTHNIITDIQHHIILRYCFTVPCISVPLIRVVPPASGTPHQNITVGFDQRPRLLHNRYTRTDTCFRWGMAVTYSRYKFVTVSLPKRFRNGRFTSETATWIQKY